MMTTTMIFAGSGGQGIQFSGKQMAKSGMYSGYQVTFPPTVPKCAVVHPTVL